ncbi:hypothetical protein AB1Y20_013820 [Prymnesium parvum]|uniref:Indole-3-glycerol-phosphate synthase n=1 Tax=Prymnesium parvum TaxID=97485 RepID=A0AB34IEN8_PRYPA
MLSLPPLIALALAFTPLAPRASSRLALPPRMHAPPPSPLERALRPRRGSLAVSLEYSAPPPHADLEALGEALRAGGAAAVWTADLSAAAALAAEQRRARGDFPGPCAVVFCGAPSDAAAAAAAGATAVVLREGSPCEPHGAAVVWEARDEAELARLVGAGAAGAFLLPAALLPALPAGALGVVPLEPMQPGDAEVARGRALAAEGASLLVRRACVGDAEDLPYVRFVLQALKSKKSSAFAIDGHTGAVNGHFGARTRVEASPAGGWARARLG